MDQSDIKKRKVVAGSSEVSISKWYNPFSWGDTETVYSYKDEEFVDLEALWKARRTGVEALLDSMVNSAINKIENDKDRLVDNFVAFMNREFDIKFKELLNSLSEKTCDQKVREQAIAEAKTLHRWIEDFKAKLDRTLAI